MERREGEGKEEGGGTGRGRVPREGFNNIQVKIEARRHGAEEPGGLPVESPVYEQKQSLCSQVLAWDLNVSCKRTPAAFRHCTKGVRCSSCEC